MSQTKLNLLTTTYAAAVHTPVNITVPHACARHDTSRSYLYRLAGEGKIIMRKNGRRTLVDVESLDKYFTSLPVAKIKPCTRGAS